MRKSFKTLMFHGVADELAEHCVFAPSRNCFVRTPDFEKVIEYCSRRFKILRIEDLDDYYNGTAKEDGIFISVDDGLQYFFDHAVPVLKKYKAPATVFLTSDWTNEGIEPAIFSLEYHLYHHLPAALVVTHGDFYFEKQVDQKKEIPAVLSALWNTLFQKQVAANAIRANEIKLNGLSMDQFSQEGNPQYWKPASWQTIRGAMNEGLIQVGAHGKTHTPFSWLTPQRLQQEFAEDRKQIEHHLGAEVTTCTFPHGMYDATTLAMVDREYRFGFTNRPISSETRSSLSRYNVPYQRPNSIGSLIDYPLAGKILRKLGAVSGLY